MRWKMAGDGDDPMRSAPLPDLKPMGLKRQDHKRRNQEGIQHSCRQAQGDGIRVEGEMQIERAMVSKKRHRGGRRARQ